jgi:hypothetical protein
MTKRKREALEAQPSTVVTTSYRYKRPPRRRKTVPLAGPAVVAKRTGKPKAEPATAPLRLRPTMIGSPSPRKSRRSSPHARKRYHDVPDLTPEEHKRRGDAADAKFQEMKRRIAEKLR